MSAPAEIPAYSILPCFGIVGPPAPVKSVLNAIRDEYNRQAEQLRAERQAAYKGALEMLAHQPDVLPLGTKFIRWHRIKAKRIELEVVRHTVRAVFESWELVYICRQPDGKEVEVDAGSMSPNA